MIIKHTRDTLSETYLDAVALFGTPFSLRSSSSIEIDANEAYCILCLYDDKDKAAATVRLLPNKICSAYPQRMAVLKGLPRSGLGHSLERS